jgi:hypothetical protein
MISLQSESPRGRNVIPLTPGSTPGRCLVHVVLKRRHWERFERPSVTESGKHPGDIDFRCEVTPGESQDASGDPFIDPHGSQNVAGLLTVGRTRGARRDRSERLEDQDGSVGIDARERTYRLYEAPLRSDPR